MLRLATLGLPPSAVLRMWPTWTWTTTLRRAVLPGAERRLPLPCRRRSYQYVSLQVAQWCTDRGIGLVTIGPEAPLVAGLSDALRGAGVR